MAGRERGTLEWPGEFLLHAPGLDRPILMSDASEVAESLAGITRGWAWQPVPAGTDAAELASIRVGWAGDGYVVDSAWLGAPMIGLSAVGAACSIACDLGLASIDADGQGIGLHCGAVEIGGRLVVLAGPRRAGKSTLVSRLGADGVRVYADDILPLGPGDVTGVALGIAPRLRLPLPRQACPAFRAHVAAHVAAMDDRYGYVMPPDLAPRGSEAPIGVILLLDRRPRTRARLRAATRADALRLLVLRNLASGHDPAPLIARLEALVDRAEVCWLEYAGIDEAAALVRTAFAAGAAPPALAPARPSRLARPAARGTAALSRRRYRTRPGIGLREVGGEAFLSDPAEKAILHLNAIGAAIWSLLAADGASEAEAAAALSGAYPGTDPARIAADVAALYADLRAARLIAPASPRRGGNGPTGA